MDLISKLPSTVNIEGREVEINKDFRTSIKFEGLFKENLTAEEFWNKALKIYYPILDKTIMIGDIENIQRYEFVINNIDEAIKQMLWFYRCGKEVVKEEGQQTNEVISYEYDADYIYSAFLDQYGIDLTEQDNLHWWKFKAMFKALKADNEISRIMSIRATDTIGLKGKELDHYKKLKKIYAIPHDKEEVKRNKSIAEILKRGGDLSELEE